MTVVYFNCWIAFGRCEYIDLSLHFTYPVAVTGKMSGIMNNYLYVVLLCLLLTVKGLV